MLAMVTFLQILVAAHLEKLYQLIMGALCIAEELPVIRKVVQCNTSGTTFLSDLKQIWDIPLKIFPLLKF